jgi:hypothetical protein
MTLSPLLSKNNSSSSSTPTSPSTSPTRSTARTTSSQARPSTVSESKLATQLSPRPPSPADSPNKPKSKSKASTGSSSSPNKTQSPVSSGPILTSLIWALVASIQSSLIFLEGRLPPEGTPVKLLKNSVSNISRVFCSMDRQALEKPSLPGSWPKLSMLRI